MATSISPIAPTRNARLACACNCAYGIGTKDGVYSPPAIYDAGVGWSSTPQAFSAPKADDPTGPRINACLVGINKDGIIVAMRGTLPPAWTVASIEDWWQDIVDSAPIAAPPLTGKVHEGFWDALQTIWSDVIAEIKRLKTEDPGNAIYVTGHSKGGPLASIGSALMFAADDIAAAELVTFASPHPGDQEFVDNYPASIPVIRFENYLDIVPFLPPTDTFYTFMEEIIPSSWKKEICGWFPSLCKALEHAAVWDYAALGPLHYITKNGTVVDQHNPDANPDVRLVSIVLTLVGLDTETSLDEAIKMAQAPKLASTGLARIGAAHCIACKCEQPNDHCAGGYMTGAGGNPIC